MSKIQSKKFDSPDETMTPVDNVKVDVVTVGGLQFQRITAEPGWKWSKHLKPVVKTESCEKHHVIYMISGRLSARMNDGKEEEFGPGEIAVVSPGHDGWTVGNEPAVWLEIPH